MRPPALKGRNWLQQLNTRELCNLNNYERFGASHFALSGLGTQLNIIQGRRSFVACPWLLHFAPLALGPKNKSTISNHPHVRFLPARVIIRGKKHSLKGYDRNRVLIGAFAEGRRGMPVVSCSQCGTKNRVDLTRAAEGQAKCG